VPAASTVASLQACLGGGYIPSQQEAPPLRVHQCSQQGAGRSTWLWCPAAAPWCAASPQCP
jgi:hypothetical protein